ncbi:MAG: methylenetetrahydrofolate--tRNA-(uracil(54)-C(5))-methyltransferase (FADH(2)-oxidizing) TrmFO [Oscillospiraceae bacterium]|nr:methylenetetrahydrofolate--tRNA-(uracil(54)-C(5))-methyltransferase (FADH(2)-oxidizing) TrmFO [Oscillospiraceae bacterium]
MNKSVTVVGGGLAGCEAAYRLADLGFAVTLYEMKPIAKSPAHQMDSLAELVCSNSLKAARVGTAAGLLKAEMRLMGSLLLEIAERCAVPAGGALAVDRDEFSRLTTQVIEGHQNIRLVREEVTALPDPPVIIATGPLTSPALSQAIGQRLGRAHLSFYDAAAPIVTAGSIDKSIAFPAARYGRGGEDYLNCPMNQEEYEHFWEQLVAGERAPLKDFEGDGAKFYEGCMPVEVLAGRGKDALRFGPLKPVGLTDPRTGRRPWAVVQLRQENAAATLYNLVGFQTNLKFGEQKRVFSLIPGLGNAEFARFGVMHRNTFIDSPRLLDRTFALREQPLLCFAGQLTGVEGYMESAASGILAAGQLARRLTGRPVLELPPTTMLGALSSYIADESVTNFQPMGASMGLLPSLEVRIKSKQERYEALAERALQALKSALG